MRAPVSALYALSLPRESPANMSNDLPRLALSVRQPWAWAILHAGKRLENRSQAAIDHGMKEGLICLHASKGMSREEYESGRDFINAAINRTNYPDLEVPKPCDLVRGGIIGTMYVCGVAKSAEDVDNNPWFIGPRALILRQVDAIDPIACVGALGYFDWRKGLDGSPRDPSMAGARQVIIDPPKPWMTAWPADAKRQTKSQYEREQQQARYTEAMRLSSASRDSEAKDAG